jgi:rare lipoprotein A
VPDAEPRLETARTGGPNKPYEALGQAYVPQVGDPVVVERGLASWYGRKFHGRPTASGERYDMYAMSAAHRTMPLPSYARVRNPANGREVVVRVNDRGPFKSSRIIDLSYTAALKLGVLGGVASVEVERITQEAIRTGSWRRPAGDPALAASPQPAAGTADPIGDIARRVAAESP